MLKKLLSKVIKPKKVKPQPKPDSIEYMHLVLTKLSTAEVVHVTNEKDECNESV